MFAEPEGFLGGGWGSAGAGGVGTSRKRRVPAPAVTRGGDEDFGLIPTPHPLPAGGHRAQTAPNPRKRGLGTRRPRPGGARGSGDAP